MSVAFYLIVTTMIIFERQLGPGELYVCKKCNIHLSRVHLKRSDRFKGKTGTAYLIAEVWNYVCGPEEDRQLSTGEHTIREIYCQKCHTNIGWTYIRAYQESQKYKIGKFILEAACIRKVRCLKSNRFIQNSSQKRKDSLVILSRCLNCYDDDQGEVSDGSDEYDLQDDDESEFNDENHPC